MNALWLFKHSAWTLNMVNKIRNVDFKTSKAVYSDMLIQLSCYAELIKENDGIEIDRAVIVRFPKDDDETEIKKFFKDDLAVGLKQFKLLRKAFDLDKDLNKILKGKK